MTIDALARNLTPPPTPVETLGDWNAVEASLGVSLPDDFKEYIATYGSGSIGEFITVLNPFSIRPSLNFMEQSKRQLDALRELHDTFGEPQPFELYPANPGLLPVAMTDNGDVIHWLTADNPPDWTIVVNAARSPDYEHFKCNLIDFILGVIEKSIRVNIFPRSIFPNSPKFLSI